MLPDHARISLGQGANSTIIATAVTDNQGKFTIRLGSDVPALHSLLAGKCEASALVTSDRPPEKASIYYTGSSDNTFNFATRPFS